MRLSPCFAVVLFGLISVINGAAVNIQERGLRSTPTVSSDVEIVWPGSASINSAKRGGMATNAEIMKQGGTPARPRKLFTAQADSDLAKRVVGAPPTAQASSAAGTFNYKFDSCVNNANRSTGFKTTTITYSSLQDFADQCALIQAGQPAGSAPNFILEVTSPTSGICYSSTVPRTGSPPVTCTANNYAVYVPQ